MLVPPPMKGSSTQLPRREKDEITSRATVGWKRAG